MLHHNHYKAYEDKNYIVNMIFRSLTKPFINNRKAQELIILYQKFHILAINILQAFIQNLKLLFQDYPNFYENLN